MKNEQETIFLNALEENQDKLFRICSIYSEDSEDAKDLFQEVLVNIWKSMSGFAGNSSMSTWMFRITLNICLRFKSKHKTNQKRFIRLDSMSIANFGFDESRETENEKLRGLRKCIKRLNDGEKALVALYLEGIPYKKIANILGLSENHVAVKIKRIKSKLLTCINHSL